MPHQKIVKIQSSTTAPRDDDPTRPAAQSATLEPRLFGVSVADGLRPAFWIAIFLALMPKMSATNPMHAAIKLNDGDGFLPRYSADQFVMHEASRAATIPSKANGSDNSSARVRAAFGSGGADGSSLKIQFFIAS